MSSIASQFAQQLLEVQCIKLQPTQPFTWASGWLSPFYCDNRKTLAYPKVRTFVKEQLAAMIREQYPEATAIAGVADALNLPMCYVRAKAKDHGMGNLIEGTLPEGAKVVVVEDLISTGGSSLKAVEALRAAGFEILGMVASFTYGFPVAEEAFRAANVTLTTLTNYEAVVETARAIGYIEESHLPLLARWRANPSTWSPEV